MLILIVVLQIPRGGSHKTGCTNYVTDNRNVKNYEPAVQYMHLPRLVGHIDADLCEGVCAIVMTIPLLLRRLCLLLFLLCRILRWQGICSIENRVDYTIFLAWKLALPGWPGMGKYLYAD